MIPDKIEEFENNNVRLTIHHFDGLKRCWLEVGIAALMVETQDMEDIVELLTAYLEEEVE